MSAESATLSEQLGIDALMGHGLSVLDQMIRRLEAEHDAREADEEEHDGV